MGGLIKILVEAKGAKAATSTRTGRDESNNGFGFMGGETNQPCFLPKVDFIQLKKDKISPFKDTNISEEYHCAT